MNRQDFGGGKSSKAIFTRYQLLHVFKLFRVDYSQKHSLSYEHSNFETCFSEFRAEQNPSFETFDLNKTELNHASTFFKTHAFITENDSLLPLWTWGFLYTLKSFFCFWMLIRVSIKCWTIEQVSDFMHYEHFRSFETKLIG